MTQDDEGGRKHRPLVEGHDQLVALELPHLIGDGLHFEECIAKMTNSTVIGMTTVENSKCEEANL